MKELSLRQLEYFVAVAETRSMTLAAEQCHVSQAAVSLAILHLESVLGVTLAIRRRAKGVSLTAEGQVALAGARQVLDEVGRLAETVRGAHGALSGRLTIGCFRTLSMHVIPPLVEWFALRHPTVTIDFVEGSGPEIMTGMQTGQTQLCVVYEAQLSGGCVPITLRTMHRQVVVSPSHPLATAPEIRFGDLARYPAILVDEEPALQRTLAEFHAHGVEPDVRWRSTSVQAIQSIVGRGLAYSLLMQPATVSPDGRPLLYRGITDRTATNSVMAALPSGVRRSALVTEAVDALVTLWSRDPHRGGHDG